MLVIVYRCKINAVFLPCTYYTAIVTSLFLYKGDNAILKYEKVF